MAEFTEMVLCGYQGWFAAGIDNTLERWSHWSKRGEPGPGNTAFELYPDLREYPQNALRQTGYGRLGNGQESRLFGSERDGVIKLHFEWMRDYGIDGVALQRFLQPTRTPKNRGWRNAVAGEARRQAEAHDKTFYIMYDISGANWPATHPTVVEEIRDDVADQLVGTLDLMSSPSHARQGGRPVVAIWGFGFPGKKASVDEALATVNMLRDEFGCYVVLGVPYRWRDEKGDSLPGWLPVYESADMLIPWAVGRYKTPSELDGHINGIWGPDKQFCDARGIDLQRVIFPGFAWSNLKSQQVLGVQNALSRHAEVQAEPAPRNSIKRNQGDFLWAQAFQVAQYGTSAFVAMFDEYDEATAIAKAAEDVSMLPVDEYFLTLDADGGNLPSDHYLWLTGELTKMIKDPSIAMPQRPDRPDPAPIDPPPPPPPAPIWTAQEARLVVEHAYLGLLDRGADPNGHGHFADRLTDGDTTERVCQTLVSSDEFRNTNDGVPAVALAKRLYTKLLTRPDGEIDSGGLNITINAISSGMTARRAARMLESPEFRNRVLDP